VRDRFAVYLALRYLRSARRDAFTSFLSAVAGAGIGLGVAALVLALAALAGMQHRLRSEILERTPSVAVDLPDGADRFEAFRTIDATPGVVARQRVLEGQGWVLHRGTALPVRLLGYEGEPPRTLPGVEGRPPGLFLPDAVALRLGVSEGEIVDLASPRPALTPLGPSPRLLSVRIEGVYRASRVAEEPIAALPIERAQVLLGARDGDRLLLRTESLGAAEQVAEELRRRLPEGTRVETWRELNRPLFFALTLERTLLFVGVSLVVAVAAVALFSDLQLLAATKRRELALLAAMGAGAGDLKRAFVVLGSILGGGGALVGGAVGATSAWALDRWQLVRLPQGLLLFDALPFEVRWSDLLAVVGLTVALTWVCSAWGAARASRVSPATELRG